MGKASSDSQGDSINLISRNLFRDIREKIRKAALTGDSVSQLSSAILSLVPREISRVLFELLRKEPVENVIVNIMNLFADLIRRSPKWVKIVQGCVRKRGRCPKPLRPNVAALLQDKASLAREVKSLREVLSNLQKESEEIVAPRADADSIIRQERGLFWKSHKSVRAKITKALLDIMHMEELARVLSACEPPPKDVLFDMEGVEHAYVVGLVALVAWCKKWSIEPDFKGVNADTMRYLDRIGFIREVRGSGLWESFSESTHAMAIESLGKGKAPEEVAGKLVDIIKHHNPLPPAEESGLTVLFSELVENIGRHAGPYSSAFAVAQVYPLRKKLTICIIDTGMGVRRSFEEGDNADAKRQLAAGEYASKLACLPLVTSKPQRHSGYGLYVAGELITRNGGTFRLLSGNEVYTRYLQGWTRMENASTFRGVWQGTWLSMIVNLGRTISVTDVYKTLPPVPGSELEEFFA